MVQTEIILLSKLELLDNAKTAAISLFNQYFGGGMNSIVFQEIREAQGLAYSVYSTLSQARKSDQSDYLFSYVGIQSDKQREALSSMFELINNLPISPQAFEISKKAIFTNDLLELKQVKIVINSLEVLSREEELRFKSSLNYLILDEKINIPFWVGDRTLTKSGESFTFANRWNFGFDNVDRDGYFIGRKFNSINLSDDLVCLLYTSPSPRDRTRSRMPSSA